MSSGFLSELEGMFLNTGHLETFKFLNDRCTSKHSKSELCILTVTKTKEVIYFQPGQCLLLYSNDKLTS